MAKLTMDLNLGCTFQLSRLLCHHRHQYCFHIFGICCSLVSVCLEVLVKFQTGLSLQFRNNVSNFYFLFF